MTGFYEDYDDTSGVHLGTAEEQAINAANSATAAANSATAAATSETNAAASATSASGASSAASTSATNAATSATNAATSETNASNSETNAANSASAASTSETNAATSATNASTSETNAAASATAAATSETNASTSETNAAASATAAANSATAAATSETNASTSETNAAASATAAATSETNAATSETNAATSETNAATSATNAATSETNAATSETNASTSETNASNSATSAATAQTAAEAARDAALAAFDSFDDRYLGPYSSDPTTDNDGDALAAGMLYYNTTDDVMKVYEGSSWVAAYASLSGALIANNNLSDLNNAGAARTNLGLGTAATTAASDYATAAQADQTVTLTGTGATSVSGTYPNFTITSTDTDTDTDTTYTEGTGITLTGTEFSLTDTNDKLNLTGGSLTGDLDVTGSVQAIYTDSTTTTMFGYGLEFSRTSSYIRPTTDGTQTLYFGDAGTTLDWEYIALRVSDDDHVLINGNKVYHAGNDGAGSGLDAATLLGLSLSAGGNRWGVIPKVDASGVMEVGEYIDFHENDNNQSDHAFRLQSDGNVGGASLTAHGHLVLNNGATDGARLYLRSNVAPTFGINNNGGNLVFDDGTEVMRLNYQNRVGIGTSSPAQALHVVGSIVATGNITAYYSDERLKDFKGKIDNPLEKINTLNGYYFKPNETALIAGAEQNGLEVGVSAQEVEKVLPEIVSPSALGKDYKTVSYEKLTPLLIEAVKELSAKVDDLELRLQNLEK